MEGQLRSSRQPAGSFTREALRALRALDAAGHDPVLIGYHPPGGLNPYLGLLYQRTWQAGLAAVPIVREEAIVELTELARAGFTTVLHLHWLNRILGRAATLAEARENHAAFLGRLDRHRDDGGRICWTVHNILPHGARFEAEEARLSADVIERCDVVHVLAAGTPDHVAPWFTIPPEKLLHVPHPSYAGAYEDRMTREQARHELGIWPDEVTYVLLGAIRPYKGLDRLVDAWDALVADGRPRRLVVAGRAGDKPAVTAFIERAAAHPSILVHAASFEPSDVQIYLRAADIAVHPHVRGLNSGGLLLALTFGLPVVVPAGGGLAEVVDRRCARTFVEDDPADLVRALRAADELLDPAARSAALEIAARHAPGPLADRFATGLRARVTGGVVPSA